MVPGAALLLLSLPLPVLMTLFSVYNMPSIILRMLYIPILIEFSQQKSFLDRHKENTHQTDLGGFWLTQQQVNLPMSQFPHIGNGVIIPTQDGCEN